MARLPRLALAGHAHLVWMQACSGTELFDDHADRRRLLDALRQAAAQHHVAVHAYALCASHVLLLVTPSEAKGVARLVQDLGRRWVATRNRRAGHIGSPWSGRYGAAILEPGVDVFDALVFVDLSGSRENGDAEHGSAPHHLGRTRVSWLAPLREYWALGNTPFDRELRYAQLLEAGLPECRTEQITRAARSNWALGSPPFVARVAEQAGRPAVPRRRGRPKRAP
ncbi:MAG TPA: transposase [Burkholderiaceae bacterium]|jgi:putative transposase|nr:transposase [Burkholderiaceae bacterium]